MVDHEYEIEQNNDEIAVLRENIADAKRQKWNGWTRDVSRMMNRIVELEMRNERMQGEA